MLSRLACKRPPGGTSWRPARGGVGQRQLRTGYQVNVHAPSLFVPPRPAAPAKELGLYRFLIAVRTNALQIWSKSAYEQDVVVGSALGRTRLLINAPDAIHRVLVDNTANYCRTSATIRILRPIVGKGLFLSEGE